MRMLPAGVSTYWNVPSSMRTPRRRESPTDVLPAPEDCGTAEIVSTRPYPAFSWAGCEATTVGVDGAWTTAGCWGGTMTTGAGAGVAGCSLAQAPSSARAIRETE